MLPLRGQSSLWRLLVLYPDINSTSVKNWNKGMRMLLWQNVHILRDFFYFEWKVRKFKINEIKCFSDFKEGDIYIYLIYSRYIYIYIYLIYSRYIYICNI